MTLLWPSPGPILLQEILCWDRAQCFFTEEEVYCGASAAAERKPHQRERSSANCGGWVDCGQSVYSSLIWRIVKRATYNKCTFNLSRHIFSMVWNRSCSWVEGFVGNDHDGEYVHKKMEIVSGWVHFLLSVWLVVDPRTHESLIVIHTVRHVHMPKCVCSPKIPLAEIRRILFNTHLYKLYSSRSPDSDGLIVWTSNGDKTWRLDY